jgi:hypothetical protein
MSDLFGAPKGWAFWFSRHAMPLIRTEHVKIYLMLDLLLAVVNEGLEWGHTQRNCTRSDLASNAVGRRSAAAVPATSHMHCRWPCALLDEFVLSLSK